MRKAARRSLGPPSALDRQPRVAADEAARLFQVDENPSPAANRRALGREVRAVERITHFQPQAVA